MVNILNHKLVPKHEVLPSKERKELLESLRAEKEQLPMILESDPVAKEIEAKKGDILRITRQSVTGGEAVYYRLVV